MPRILAGLALAISICALTACNQGIAVLQAKQLSPEAAQDLAAMPFGHGAPVSVQGRVTTALFGGTTGMIIVEASGGSGKYAFSTAATPGLAKQGFTRFSLQPGQQVTVTGVLADSGEKIEGFIAARADSITTSDGVPIFSRAAL